MEFWDVLEDSQYLHAVASVNRGPRPICKWEIPTGEQLQEWEERVKAEEAALNNKNQHRVEPFTLDWYVASPIGFFFFSCFVRDFSEERLKAAQIIVERSNANQNNDRNQENNKMNAVHISTREKRTSAESNTTRDSKASSEDPANTHTVEKEEEREDDGATFLSDKYACVRMNFLENILRFQKIIQKSRNKPKVVKFAQSILKYLELPQRDPDTDEVVLPEVTPIRESDLHLPKYPPRTKLGLSTQAEVKASYTLNRDETYRSNIIGLKGPLLEEMVTAIQDWIQANVRVPYTKGQSMPQLAHEKWSEHEAENENEGHRPQNYSDSKDNNEDKKESDEEEIGEEKVDKDMNCATNIPRESLSKSVTIAPGAKQKQDRESFIVAKGNTSVLRRVMTDEGQTHHHQQQHRHVKCQPSNKEGLQSIFRKVEAIVFESLKQDYGSKFQADSPQYLRMRNFLWFQDRRVVYEDFYIMRVLGRGGFGLVSACQKGTTGKLYAIKVMSKRRIKMKKSVQFVINERKALAAVSACPFIVNLKYSFHSDGHLYLILDLMSGGDLGFHLQWTGRFSNSQCLYYASRIMLGLQALHDKDYVYRDMKPENCLLTADGRVKITDLGLATKIKPHLPAGIVGTRGYWAPEMHKRNRGTGKPVPYNHVVDWFSFGCCLAEFISGINPFRCEAAFRFGIERGEHVKDKALDCAIKEMEPDLSTERFTPDAADLCRRLLDKDPCSRLGARGGCKEVMAHPWFKDVDWENIISDKKRPPFVPAKDVNAASQHEIGNFADDKSKSTKDAEFDEADEANYKDWDWTNPKAFASEVIEFLVYEREFGRPLLPFDEDGSCCCTLL